jgi:sterol desaturase/sphingolipid hydroxylase (fatty acid hydroxylase superfamily)
VNDVAHEIRWSMLNMTCTGLTTLVLYALIRDGHTRMYFDIDGAWAYLGFSSLLCFVGYDTWFYWQHRLLHVPWLFRHVHVIHHRSANPTAFASFAHHPIETLLGNAYFILFVVCVPIHPLALAATGAALFAVNMVTHMGYELYPAGFTRHAVLGWYNTSTHHNMHHRHVGCNYSICFNYWDRLLGTNHPAYDDTFDAIKARQEKAIAVVAS